MSTVLKRSYMSYIHTIIMFILMFGIGMLPTFGQVTPLGMKILGVFVGTLYGWLFIDLLWPSLIGLVALGMTGYTTVGEAFSEALSSSVGIQVIISCIFAGALSKIGAVDVINNWILTRKSLQKNPWLLVITIFMTVIIGTILGAGIALVFMLWTMILKAADQIGYKKNDPLIAFLMVTTVIMCFTASHTIPFRGGALLYLSFFIPTAGPMDYVPFVIFALTYTLLLLVGMILVAKYIMKVDVSRFALQDEDIEALRAVKPTRPQIIGCWIMVAFFVVMFLPAFLPKTWAITSTISSLGLIGVTAIALMLLALTKDENGNTLLKLADCHQSIPWDIVWLICATMPIANAMESQESGLMATIVTTFSPIFSSMSPTVFMIMVMVILGTLTQFTHNLVLGALFIPFLTKLCMEMNGNYYTMFMMLMFILNCAYVTPAASMQSALIHGHESVGRKSAYTWGITTLILSWIILTVVGIPLGNLLW